MLNLEGTNHEGKGIAMPKQSAGLLLYRRSGAVLEVFLVHPGGPYWAGKKKGAWGVPKGEYGADEDPLDAAQREFREETGFTPAGEFADLGTIQQRSGKLVRVWAFEGDCDPAKLVCNTCQVEWPPRSRLMIEIPEVDEGRWFTLPQARQYIRPEQGPLLDRLEHAVL
jgi:predicted NUDIX family NTP pyrophosphohydrolase